MSMSQMGEFTILTGSIVLSHFPYIRDQDIILLVNSLILSVKSLLVEGLQLTCSGSVVTCERTDADVRPMVV